MAILTKKKVYMFFVLILLALNTRIVVQTVNWSDLRSYLRPTKKDGKSDIMELFDDNMTNHFNKLASHLKSIVSGQLDDYFNAFSKGHLGFDGGSHNENWAVNERGTRRRIFFPVKALPEEYNIFVELPGVAKRDLIVKEEEQNIVVEAVQKLCPEAIDEADAKKTGATGTGAGTTTQSSLYEQGCIERQFKGKWKMPEDIDKNMPVKATLRNGLLQLRVFRLPQSRVHHVPEGKIIDVDVEDEKLTA